MTFTFDTPLMTSTFDTPLMTFTLDMPLCYVTVHSLNDLLLINPFPHIDAF